MIVQGSNVYGFLLLLMALDLVSGLLKAVKQKVLQSNAIRNGVLKKSGTFLGLILSYILDELVNNGSPVFQTIMVIMAVCDESLSIIENLSVLGVPFPKSITSRLNNMKNEINDPDAEKKSDVDRTLK
jgi:toxin secretion/phage lysis holin